MRNTIALVAAGLLATTLIQPSRAADLDYQPMIQELVVSGMIESWTGYTFIGSNDRDDDLSDYFNGQRSLRLSLPLGSNLSIQMDADSSLNSSWLFDDGDDYEEH